MTRKQLNKLNAIKPLNPNRWGHYTRKEKVFDKWLRLSFYAVIGLAALKLFYSI